MLEGAWGHGLGGPGECSLAHSRQGAGESASPGSGRQPNSWPHFCLLLMASLSGPEPHSSPHLAGSLVHEGTREGGPAAL